MTRTEAHELLFKGQTNVTVVALELGVELKDLKKSFRAFVTEKPSLPKVWVE